MRSRQADKQMSYPKNKKLRSKRKKTAETAPIEKAELTVDLNKKDKYFEILVSKDDVVNGKPNPETFLKCAEQMNVAPELCQVFEDGDPGIKAALEVGMKVTDVRKYL